MWRTLSLVIIGFWAVMTSLLVRYVWFPEGTRFSEVPPSVVLREFLEQSSELNTASTLYIYRGDRKIGEAHLRCIRTPPKGPDFMLFFEGRLNQGAVPFAEERVGWSLKLKLLNGEHFGELSGKVHMERSPKIVQFLWRKGQRTPTIRVHGAEDAGASDMMIQVAMAQALSGTDPAGLAGGNAEGLLRIRARESAMDFAGQKSQGYLLEFTVMDRWKARVFITEAGEFVLMDLPEGYRLVEPVIHGLAPDYDAELEEELEKEKAEAGGKQQ